MTVNFRVVPHWLCRSAACALLAGTPAWAASDAFHEPVQTAAALADLSLEDLAQVRVTSVSGRPQAVQVAPASVYVITAEDIRRSSAATLPEALRLAPNLQVARLSSTQWSISARGFNNAIGNKLLVLVDGRTVYSPMFSGVQWDAQQVLLEDVERIEVISGPGATLWGANAVNGVINVVTRPARQTTGTLAVVRGGGDGWHAAARWGATADSGAAWRVWAQRSGFEASRDAAGAARPDAARKDHVGFRTDWGGARSQFTLQGDAYESPGNGVSNVSPYLAGGNLLGRWRHDAESGGNWELQAYADSTRRRERLVFDESTHTLDLSFSHAPALRGAHRVLWGGNLRQAWTETTPTAFFRFEPEDRRLRWGSLFVQDEFEATPRLRLTAGIKAERNIYTGTEWLPSLRATWDAGAGGVVWGALSRAVRAPARLDRELFLPAAPPYLITGGPTFRSEVARVAEVGWRLRPTARSSASVTAFGHRYDRLRAGRAAPTLIENLAWGDVWGLEAWGTWEPTRTWRLSGGWVELRKSLDADPASPASSVPNLGNDPRRQWLLRASVNPGPGWEADLVARHSGALPSPAVASRTTADLRLAWRATPGLTASLEVNDLADRAKQEFDGGAVFGRTAWLRLTLRLP